MYLEINPLLELLLGNTVTVYLEWRMEVDSCSEARVNEGPIVSRVSHVEDDGSKTQVLRSLN